MIELGDVGRVWVCVLEFELYPLIYGIGECFFYWWEGRRLCIICFTPLTQADRFGGFSGVGMRRGLPFRQRWCQL